MRRSSILLWVLLLAACDGTGMVGDGAPDLALDHGTLETGSDGPGPPRTARTPSLSTPC